MQRAGGGVHHWREARCLAAEVAVEGDVGGNRHHQQRQSETEGRGDQRAPVPASQMQAIAQEGECYHDESEGGHVPGVQEEEAAHHHARSQQHERMSHPEGGIQALLLAKEDEGHPHHHQYERYGHDVRVHVAQQEAEERELGDGVVGQDAGGPPPEPVLRGVPRCGGLASGQIRDADPVVEAAVADAVGCQHLEDALQVGEQDHQGSGGHAIEGWRVQEEVDGGRQRPLLLRLRRWRIRVQWKRRTRLGRERRVAAGGLPARPACPAARQASLPSRH